MTVKHVTSTSKSSGFSVEFHIQLSYLYRIRVYRDIYNCIEYA